jgi:hypothetical protein
MDRRFVAASVLALGATLALAACSGDPPCSGGGVGCTCVADCLGKVCGDDGCGGSCGTCSEGTACDASFRCAATCAPACAGKTCGDDGCGGSCGTCAAGATCTALGACEPASISCAADTSCTFERHVAWVYECTPAATGWDCRNTGVDQGVFGDRAACDVACRGGTSGCHEDANSAPDWECWNCVQSCAVVDGVEACADEVPGACPWPCACR